MAVAFDSLLPELGIGLIAGAVVAAAIVGVALARGRGALPVPLGGLGLVVGGVFTLGSKFQAEQTVMVGLLLLALGGLVIDLWPRTWPMAPLLALPGAVAMASGTQSLLVVIGSGKSISWVVPGMTLMVVAGGFLVGCFDSRWRSQGLGPVLFAVTVGGIFLTVPETKRMLVLVGVAVAVALTAWPRPMASLGWAGSMAAVGLVASVTVLDGVERSSSIIGAVACLGLLVVEPVARGLLGGRSPIDALPRSWWSVGLVTIAHLGVVLVAARVAGLRPDLNSAALVAAGDLGISLLLVVGAAVALNGRDRRPLGY